MDHLSIAVGIVAAMMALLGAGLIYRHSPNRALAIALLLVGFAFAAGSVVSSFQHLQLTERLTATAIISSVFAAGAVCAILGCGCRASGGIGRLASGGLLLIALTLGVFQWQQFHGVMQARLLAASAQGQPQPPVAGSSTSTASLFANQKPKISPTLGEAMRDFVRNEKPPEPPAMPPATFQEENFRFTPPGQWEVLDAKKVNPIACYMLARFRDQQNVMIISEKFPAGYAPDLSVVAKFATANLVSLGIPKLISEKPFTHQGVSGLRLEHEITRVFVKTTIIHHVMINRGHLWQVIFSGPSRDIANIRKIGDQVLAGFEILDVNRTAAAPSGELIEPKFASPLGWSIDLSKASPNLPWNRKWTGLEHLYPEADFGIMNNAGTAHLFAWSVWLPESEVPIDAIADGFLLRYQLRVDSPNVTRKDHTQAGVAGVSLAFEQKDETGSLFHYRVRVLRQGHRAWFVYAGANDHSPQALASLEPALDCLEIGAAPTTPTELGKIQREAHALLCNRIALHYDRKNQAQEAFRWFKHANVDGQKDPVILTNALTLALRAGKLLEGLELYERHRLAFPGNHTVLVAAARLFAESGNRKKAREILEQAFEAGYRDDNELGAFVRLFADEGEHQKAVEIFDRFVVKKTSSDARQVRALLLVAAGRAEEAIAELIAARKDDPNAPGIVSRLAQFLANAGKHSEIVEHTSAYLGKNPPHGDILYYQGVAQLWLKRHEDAKKSFEAALALDPTSQPLKELHAAAAAALGHGDNSQIKNPVAPVPIPPHLLQAPKDAPAEYVAGYNAYFPLTVRAVSIEKDGERARVRTTEHRVVKIVDREGADAFNSLRFPFNPVAEDFYISSLVVRDEKGQTIGTGKVEDYYVLDDPNHDIASNTRIAHAPVPGLRPGCTLEYSYTRLETVTDGESPYLATVLTQAMPVLRSTFLLRAPKDAVSAEATNGVESAHEKDAQVWFTERPVPFVFEPLMARWHTFQPMVTVGDPKASWAKLGHDYLDRIKTLLEPEPSIEEVAKRLTKELNSDAEKVQALARHVQQEITYKAIEFGRRARIPQPVAAITRNRFGDCKDHSLLLHQLLRAAGIASHLTLINSGGLLRSQFASLDQFDHAIVYVPDVNGGLFVDCTRKSEPFEGSPTDFNGFEALVLDPAKPSLKKVSSSGLGKLQLSREISVKTEGDTEIRETVTATGEFATHLRDSLRHRDPESRRAAVLFMLKRAEPSLELRDLAIEDLLEPAKPLVLKITALARRKGKQIGEQFVVDLPAPWEHVYLDAGTVEKRRTPFQMPYPFEIEATIEVQAPEGWKSGQFKRTSVNKKQFSTSNSEKTSSAGSLRQTARARIGAGRFPAKDYAAYVSETESLKGMFAPEVAFEKR